jgi:hypothetical protein
VYGVWMDDLLQVLIERDVADSSWTFITICVLGNE